MSSVWRVGRALGMAKHACEELEDTVDRVLVLCVSLTRGDGLLPERIVILLEHAEVRGDRLLVTLDGSYTSHDGIDVQEVLAGRDVG